MKKTLLLGVITSIFIGCSGTNGDDAPPQGELQQDLKSIMTPKIPSNVVAKPDTVLKDSTISDSAIEE